MMQAVQIDKFIYIPMEMECDLKQWPLIDLPEKIEGDLTIQAQVRDAILETLEKVDKEGLLAIIRAVGLRTTKQVLALEKEELEGEWAQAAAQGSRASAYSQAMLLGGANGYAYHRQFASEANRHHVEKVEHQEEIEKIDRQLRSGKLPLINSESLAKNPRKIITAFDIKLLTMYSQRKETVEARKLADALPKK